MPGAQKGEPGRLASWLYQPRACHRYEPAGGGLHRDHVVWFVADHFHDDIQSAAKELLAQPESRADADRTHRTPADLCHPAPWRIVFKVTYKREHALRRPVNHHAVLETRHRCELPVICQADDVERNHRACPRPG